MPGIAVTFEKLSKKYADLKKDRNQLKAQFEAYKIAVANQLKTWSESMNNMANTMTLLSRKIDERFIKIEDWISEYNKIADKTIIFKK